MKLRIRGIDGRPYIGIEQERISALEDFPQIGLKLLVNLGRANVINASAGHEKISTILLTEANCQILGGGAFAEVSLTDRRLQHRQKLRAKLGLPPDTSPTTDQTPQAQAPEQIQENPPQELEGESEFVWDSDDFA